MRIPVVTLVLLFAVTFIIGAYIIFDVRSYSSRVHRRRNMWITLVAEALVVVLLAVAMFLPKRSPDMEVLPVMWMLYVYLTIIVPCIIYSLCSVVGRLVNMGSRRLVNYGAMVGVPLGVILFIVMWWGVISTRHNIEVVPQEIVSDRIPTSFDNYRIVQFSDIHVGTWGRDTTFISRLVDTINGLKPDLIVFTGDAVNRSTSELDPFLTVIRRLKAADGVYAVLGNHDYGDYVNWETGSARRDNLELMRVWLRQAGWKLLENEHVFLHRGTDSIALAGVGNWGEPPFKQYGDLNAAMTAGPGALSLNDDNYKILLSHNSEHWNQIVRKVSNIDLTLSGHTHAMQMTVGAGKYRWSPAAWRYDQWGGMYSDKSSNGVPVNLYVNIGAGEVGIPARFGATPEVTLFTLKSNHPVRRTAQ